MKKSQSIKQLKENGIIQEDFIVMNEDGLYFKGLYGNDVLWTPKYDEAKPLNHLLKFETLQKMCRGTELIYDYI